MDDSGPPTTRHFHRRFGPRWAAIILALGLTSIAAAEPIEDQLIHMAGDPDPRVRFQLAFTLGEVNSPGKIPALARIALQDAGDSWVRAAILSSVREDAIDLFRRLYSNPAPDPDRTATLEPLIHELVRLIGARYRSEEIDAVMMEVGRTSSEMNDLGRAALEGLADGMRLGGGGAIDLAESEPLLLGLIANRSGRVRKAALSIAGRALPAGSVALDETIGEALATATHPDRSEAERVEAIEILRLGEPTSIVPALAALLTVLQPDSVQIAALDALDELDSDQVGPAIIERWRGLSPPVRSRAWDVLLARADRVRALVAAMESGGVAAHRVDPPNRLKLLNFPDKALADRASKLFASVPEEEVSVLLEKYRPALEIEGDAAAGRTIFLDRCAQCHRAGEEGAPLGPDWTSIQDNTPETLLINILDPNRTRKPGYTAYVIETTEGRVVTGIIAASNSSSITLRTAGAVEETILRRNIQTMTDTSLSIMPEGLADGLEARDLADLLAFIKQLD